MITRIDITNNGAIGKASLVFEKGRYKYLENLTQEGLANPIAVYGRNGSGKSSLINALFALVCLLVDDKDKLTPFIMNISRLADTEVNSKPLDENDLISSMTIYFTIEEKEFIYSIATDFESIVDESLFAGGMQVFKRVMGTLSYKGETRSIEENFYPSLRDLSNESSSDENDVSKAYGFLSNIACVSSIDKYRAKTIGKKNNMDAIVDYSAEIKGIIKRYGSFPVYDVESELSQEGKKRYYIQLEKSNRKAIRLPFEFASEGMVQQSFLLSILLSLPENGVLVVDEIERALHPLTIANFLKVVNEKHIQLIFTSHNTNILSHLRPDNIFFAYWKDGYSNFKRLSNLYENIREVNNIEKMYLSATFDSAIEGE